MQQDNYLLHKLARLAKTRKWSLDDMLKRWECFEICCALEKTESLNHQVYLWSDLNPDIKDKIGLPECDVGIDYIDAELSFAGQAKHYQKKSYVSAKHIDRTRFCTYRAIKSTKNVDIMSVIEISTPENVKLGKCKVDMDDIVHNVITEARMRYWYETAIKLPISVNVKMDVSKESTLRNCQIDALKCIIPNRCNKIRAACGIGKTRIALEVIRRELGKYLVLVPSIILADQWASYLKHSNCNVVVIGTGFDTTHDWQSMDYATRSLVVVCVYNSFEEAFYTNATLNAYKYVIVDEAHHIYDKNSGRNGAIWKIVQKYDSRVLLSASLPISEDENDENKLHFNYNLRDAINDGVCVDYNMVVSFFEKRPTMKSISKYIKNNPQYVSILVYCNSITAARMGAQRCSEMNITAAAISCEESKKERNSIIQSFEQGNLRVLWSVSTLGEGVNLSCADTVIFAEPRRSAISIQQCVGRAIRLHEGKRLAHIVVCTNMDTQENSFNHPIVNIIRALSTDDPLFVAKAHMNTKHGTARILYENVKKVGINEKDCEWIKDDVFREMVKNSKWGDWMVNFHIVKEIYDNTLRLPKQCEYMGVWLNNQRQKYKKGALTEKQIELMDKTFGNWLNIQQSYDIWMMNFTKLKNIFDNNNGRFPKQSENMGTWLNTQRQNYKKNVTLTEKQIELMNGAFGDWLSTRQNDGGWMRNFSKLNKIFAHNGKLPKQSEDMGTWLYTQRHRYKTGKLNKEHIKLMNDTFGDWSVTYQSEGGWMKRYIELKSCCETINRIPSQKSSGIGRWTSYQKSLIKTGDISAERLKLLTELFDKYQFKDKNNK